MIDPIGLFLILRIPSEDKQKNCLPTLLSLSSNPGQFIEVRTSKNALALGKIFSKYSTLTTNEIAEILDLDSQKVYKYLMKLENEGLLEKSVIREGGTFRAYWKVKDKKI